VLTQTTSLERRQRQRRAEPESMWHAQGPAQPERKGRPSRRAPTAHDGGRCHPLAGLRVRHPDPPFERRRTGESPGLCPGQWRGGRAWASPSGCRDGPLRADRGACCLGPGVAPASRQPQHLARALSLHTAGRGCNAPLTLRPRRARVLASNHFLGEGPCAESWLFAVSSRSSSST